MKKVLSLILVIAMVLSSMSFAFGASTFEDIAGTDYEEAINALVSLEVITGYEDGTFRSEKAITRAEMAKVLVEALGYSDLLDSSASSFSDTKGHWASGYIAIAAGAGLVAGYPNETFLPDQTVSYAEALTMVVRAIGYTDEYLGGTWPTNFKTKAIDLGLTKDVKMATSSADRGGVAQIIFDALEVELVTINSDGDAVNTKTDGRDKLFIDNIAEYNEYYSVTTDKVDAGNKNFAGELIDLTPYVYQDLECYVDDDDQVVYVKDTNSLVYEGVVDEVYEDGDDIIVAIEESVGGSIDKVRFMDKELDDSITDIDIFENGYTKSKNLTFDDLNAGVVEDVKIIANDDKELAGDDNGKISSVSGKDDEVVGIVVTKRTDIERIDKEYKEGSDSLDGIELPVNENDDVDLDYITVTGAVDSLADIKVEDVVVAYASDDTDVIKLVVSRESVKGEITRLFDVDTIYIDGKAYDIAELSKETNFDIGDDGAFYLDQFGEIVDYDGDGAGGAPTDYAVVMGTSKGTTEEKFGNYSIDDYPEIKLATQDGEEIVYEVEIEVDDEEVSGKKVAIVDETGEVYNTSNDRVREDLIVAGEKFGTVGDIYLELNSKFLNTDDKDTKFDLVKYELNTDGRISEIEVVKTFDTTDATAFKNKDLDDAENALVEGVVVFDSGDDFDVVTLDDISSDPEALFVRNDDGEIEVVIAGPKEVNEETDTIYAYVNKITKSTNASGKKVAQYVVYTDGQRKELFADDDINYGLRKNRPISFEYDGEVIDEKVVDIDVRNIAKVATVSAINSKSGLIELNINGKTNWYALSEHGTIIELEDEDRDDGDVDTILDLDDIDEDDILNAVYINGDGEIDLIIIDKANFLDKIKY